MFGKNAKLGAEQNPSALAIQEVFFTLQGEGPFSGEQAVFVRLAGCNLACFFCDTEFDSGASNYLSIPHIIKAVDYAVGMKMSKRKLVVLTGGEPLRQNIIWLLQVLFATGTQTIQIETAGTLWPFTDASDAWVEMMVRLGHLVFVCSPKTPKVHPRIEQLCQHWKYVVADGETDPADGLPNRGTQCSTKDLTQRLYRPIPSAGLVVWVSPRDDHDPTKNALNTRTARDLALEHGYRLSLQVHKLVDLP